MAERLIESSLPSSATALGELLWDNLVRLLEGRSVRGLPQVEMAGVPLGAAVRPTGVVSQRRSIKPTRRTQLAQFHPLCQTDAVKPGWIRSKCSRPD
jgi:hypothetical protein